MTLTREGKRTVDALSKLALLSPGLALRILREIIEDGLKEAKALTPIDTASLVSTGRTSLNKSKLEGKVIFGGIWAKFSRSGRNKKFVDYAGYVEQGSRGLAGVYYLTRGMMKAISKRNSIAAKAFRSWVGKSK